MAPQADYVVSNGTGAAVRSDINGQLAAIVSNNSGATAPATTYAYQWWADTTTGLLKIRNSANSAWVTLFQLDGEWSTLPIENGTAAAPSIYFKDSGTDTGFYSPGADQIGISTGGTSRLAVSTTAVSSTLAVDHPLGAVGTPSITFTGDLNTGIYSPGADQIGISTGGTSRIVVDASGNVNIDSNTLYVDAANNRVGIGMAPASGTVVDILAANNTSLSPTLRVNSNNLAVNTSLAYDGLSGSGQVTIQAGASSALIFGANAGEKARLLSGGNFLVGATSSTKGGATNFSVIEANYSSQFGLALCTTQTTGTANFSQFVYNGTINGSISSNGTTTTYAITSDYRLKENVIPVFDGIARFKQLKPSRFNFIGHPENTVDGFLAHEVQQVIPEAVVGEKDATNEDGTIKPQGIDQSKLVPLLTAALQEAIAKIEALETRLTAAGIA